MGRRSFVLLGGFLLALALLPPPLDAAAPPATPPVAPASPTPQPPPALLTPSTATNLVFRELSEGRWLIGDVLLDQSQRTVSIPSVINLDAAPVEYLAVTTSGKTHESVLRTDAQPLHIHVAMLLLGAKTAISAAPADFHDPKQSIPGDPIFIELAWTNQQRRVTQPAESLIYNLQTRRSMSPGAWAYNGSQVVDGSFVAQKEGSIVSLITDPYALINNPRVGRENDEIWRVNTNALPAVGTPVEIILRLP